MVDHTLININLIREWLSDAGKIALARSAGNDIEIKFDSTPVTRTDKLVETFLIDRITKFYPTHGVLAEEGSFRPGSDFLWIIDPIDETRASASGLPI